MEVVLKDSAFLELKICLSACCGLIILRRQSVELMFKRAVRAENARVETRTSLKRWFCKEAITL